MPKKRLVRTIYKWNQDEQRHDVIEEYEDGTSANYTKDEFDRKREAEGKGMHFSSESIAPRRSEDKMNPQNIDYRNQIGSKPQIDTKPLPGVTDSNLSADDNVRNSKVSKSHVICITLTSPPEDGAGRKDMYQLYKKDFTA